MIRSMCRKAVLVEARNMFWLVLFSGTSGTPVELSKCVRRKNGTSLHGIKNALNWLRLYPALRKRYDRIVGRYLELTA